MKKMILRLPWDFLREEWEAGKEWWLERRHKKLILMGLFCGVVILGGLIYQLCPGGSIWYPLTVQERLDTCQLKQGQYCIQSKDSTRESNGLICYASPFFGIEELFGEDKKFILYGKVEKIKSYVMEGESIRNGKKINPVPYYAHVLTVKVKRGIYGGIHRGQQVNLLCKWKYDAGEWDYEEGEEGLFLIGGKVTEIRDNGSSIYTIGDLGKGGGNYIIKSGDYKGLEKIRSKKDAIAYYKKHGIF